MLLGGVVVGVDAVGIGQDEQGVGFEVFGEDGCGEVFVDDCFDALEFAGVVADDGDAAAAGADDDGSGLEQGADESGFDDALGGG